MWLSYDLSLLYYHMFLSMNQRRSLEVFSQYADNLCRVSLERKSWAVSCEISPLCALEIGL